RKSSAHSSIVDTQLTGTKAIMLAEPILDADGNVIAVLVVALGFDWISERLKRPSLPPDAGASLVNSSGVVLASFPQTQAVGRTIVNAEEFKTAIGKAD